jgi:signal transduction histidine kinase
METLVSEDRDLMKALPRETLREVLDAYYRPLEARLRDVEGQLVGQRVLDNLRREVRAYHEGKGQSGHEMFVLEHY